ncbi:MAG TPA: hypothetical protein VFQ53_18385 [Kofleriaceae bacterium]|nr:hypothetical protein [Kofleriaceae bacterium]
MKLAPAPERLPSLRQIYARAPRRDARPADRWITDAFVLGAAALVTLGTVVASVVDAALGSRAER